MQVFFLIYLQRDEASPFKHKMRDFGLWTLKLATNRTPQGGGADTDKAPHSDLSHPARFPSENYITLSQT